MSNAKFDMKNEVVLHAESKKQVNEHLKRIKDIRNGKVDDRYTGLKMSECETAWEKIYWNVVTSDIGDKPDKDIFNEIYKQLGLSVGESKEFEKNMNGVIIRNLPANVKYHLTGAGSFAEGDGWCCENCGRFIRHWHSVKPDGKEREHLIGSECINTVVKYEGIEEWHARQLLADAAKWQRFGTSMRKLLKEGGRIEQHGDQLYFYKKDSSRWRGICAKDKWESVNRKGVRKDEKQTD